MTSKRYTGNIITDNPSTPANNYQNTPASGVWGIYEVADLVKAGLWPTLGNIDPNKFIENIYSTYLYTGDASTQTITNGIDLAGEGGLVWIKNRTQGSTRHPVWFDTERGVTKELASYTTNGESTDVDTVTSFNSNGFSIGADVQVNDSSDKHVSWTFRKAPKFFDVVTYTGDGVAGRTVSHNLGSVPGCIIVKAYSAGGAWVTYHRSNGSDKYMYLQDIQAVASSTSFWNDTDPTATEFTVGDNSGVNNSGRSYVAYLFAHNNSDGGFGPDGDQDIIKCGSYTGTGAAGNNVNLGFEPQWLMIKRTNSAGNWQIADLMRGMPNNGGAGAYQRLLANASDAEASGQEGPIPTATGFVLNSTSTDTNGSGSTYIYIAIRRGPMAVPTSGTNVFHVDDQSTSISEAPRYRSGFVTDFYFWKEKHTVTDWTASTRLLGTDILKPNLTSGDTSSSIYTWDFMNGALNVASADANKPAWMWKRAPNFFDVVAYTGTSTSGDTVNHSLGVVPEMIWIKSRQGSSYPWIVYNKDVGNSAYLKLNEDFDTNPDSTGDYFNNTTPTSTVFTLGSNNEVNRSNYDYVAYLFASLAGVSKIGNYTGNGTNQTIDCGFTSGARFIIIKRYDADGDWYLWDTERGIVTGNDPHLSINSTAAEVTTDDSIDPDNSGFIVNQVSATNINVSSATYIFYAIA